MLLTALLGCGRLAKVAAGWAGGAKWRFCGGAEMAGDVGTPFVVPIPSRRQASRRGDSHRRLALRGVCYGFEPGGMASRRYGDLVLRSLRPRKRICPMWQPVAARQSPRHDGSWPAADDRRRPAFRVAYCLREHSCPGRGGSPCPPYKSLNFNSPAQGQAQRPVRTRPDGRRRQPIGKAGSSACGWRTCSAFWQ